MLCLLYIELSLVRPFLWNCVSLQAFVQYFSFNSNIRVRKCLTSSIGQSQVYDSLLLIIFIILHFFKLFLYSFKFVYSRCHIEHYFICLYLLFGFYFRLFIVKRRLSPYRSYQIFFSEISCSTGLYHQICLYVGSWRFWLTVRCTSSTIEPAALASFFWIWELLKKHSKLSLYHFRWYVETY